MWKWFAQAEQITKLSNSLEFECAKNAELQTMLDKADAEIGELKKSLEASRKSEMRTLRHHADVIGKSVKIPSSFVAIAEKEEPKQPAFQFDVVQEDRVLFAAEAMYEADKKSGITPASIDEYATIIRENPDAYLI